MSSRSPGVSPIMYHRGVFNKGLYWKRNVVQCYSIGRGYKIITFFGFLIKFLNCQRNEGKKNVTVSWINRFLALNRNLQFPKLPLSNIASQQHEFSTSCATDSNNPEAVKHAVQQIKGWRSKPVLSPQYVVKSHL